MGGWRLPGSTLKCFATGFAALSRRATAPLQRAIVGSGPTALPSLSAHVLASNSSTSLGATAAPRWPTLHDPECLRGLRTHLSRRVIRESEGAPRTRLVLCSFAANPVGSVPSFASVAGWSGV